MKIKLINRTIEINKNRININDFKQEDCLIGISFNKKQMGLKDYKKLFLFLFMPYECLNKKFLKNQL